MSDSDDDLLSNSVFTLPNNGSTIMSAKGPDINVNFALPRTLGPPRYAESNYERQRNKRDMSPMSVASACDARFRTFNNSYYPRAMSSQRSAYNWRSGSPMSTRTCDTNTTLTAMDIAEALTNPTFNKMDSRIINKAINRWKAIDRRKRIEKRRKQRRFLERNKRLSYDSGEQASLSSSSDDNRSTKTTGYRKNMSSCRSTKTDISDFRRPIQDSNIYKDCTDNFRQNSRNFPNRPVSNSTFMPINSARNANKNLHESRNKSVFVFGNQLNFRTQRERFQNGFLLPSQRFDKSIVTSTIQETQRHHVEDTDSDDNIFSASNYHDKALSNRKRTINKENAVLPNNKRLRVISPCKNSTEARRAKEIDNTNMPTKSNEFVFAKPSLPIRKTVKEKLISQSAPPLPDIVVSDSTEKQPINKEISKDNEEISHNVTQSTDVSMRRKLFTQKLDIAENNNVSSDNSEANSPQESIYSAIQKERHKARKLVTNQSCLNREIEDDNNFLALIHKIVPPHSMNVTTQSNKTEIQSSKNKLNNNDKWDVSSIISMKNNEDDCSDTFTDEDIFNGDNNNTVQEVPSEKKTNKNKTPNHKKVPSKDKLVSEKVSSKDKDPISEKVTSKDKLPISEEVTRKDKRLISEKVTTKDKLLFTEKITSKDKLSIYEEVARKDKLPISEKVTTKGKLPASEEVTSKDKLPVSQKPPSAFTKPPAVSALKNHEETLCKVMVQKMPITTLNGPGVKNCVRTFWDTDSESDIECLTAKRNNFKENNNDIINPQEKVAPYFKRVTAIFKNTTPIVDTSKISMAETTHIFNATSFKIRSHRSTKPKKCCEDNKENTLKSYFDPLNKKQKSNELIQTDNKKCDDKIENHKNNISTTNKKREIKPNMTKILKTPPKAKQNKKLVEVENTDQATEQKELAKKQEPTKAQTKKQETAKAQAKKQEPATAQAKKQERDKAQAKKQEPAKAQTKKQETAKAQSKKQETAKIKDNEPENKQKATAKKSGPKTAIDTKTPPKTKPNENETPKTRANSKNARNKKILLEISSLSNSTLENDSSRIIRPIRSCRLNSSANSSKGSFNITMTLRPRKTSSKVKCINLSTPSMNERAI